MVLLARAPASSAAALGGFKGLDYLALGLYLALLVSMGFYFAGRENTTEDYFLAGRRIPWWAAGLSVYATQLSSISFKMLELEQREDDRDDDGISGRLNQVWSEENQDFAVGRFGWKAGRPDLRELVAIADANGTLGAIASRVVSVNVPIGSFSYVSRPAATTRRLSERLGQAAPRSIGPSAASWKAIWNGR